MGGGMSSEAGAAAPGAAEVSDHPSALVVCGPSGVGKGTLIKRLMDGNERFGFSCSHTTRAPRDKEQNGVHYWFTTREKFEKGIEEGKFLEYAYLHNNLYGTSLKAVQDVAAAGRCCVLDIDVQGARLVRRSALKAIFVFIAPPDEAELERRLRGRGTESEDQIQQRLATAKEELASVKEEGLYDYVIVNESLDEALRQLQQVAARALAGRTGHQAGQGGPLTLVAKDPAKDATPAPPATAGAEEAVPPLESGPSADAKPQAAPSATAATPAQDATAPATAAAVSADASATAENTANAAMPKAVASAGMERWRGKVALVTGASAGIGWAVCEALAGAGMRVCAVARRRERLEALQRALVAAGTPIHAFLPVVCDITKEAEVVALPRILAKRWPGAGVDVLVNNAGMARNNAALWDGSTASWVEMVSTNILGPAMATREALQDMKARGQYGHIINISSMSGHRVPNGAAGGAFYAATKHALRAMTEGLRQEARAHKAPLRVSSISPGLVDTEFSLVHAFGRAEDAAKHRPAIDKALEPGDVAAAVVWCLAAPDHVDVHDILLRPTSQLT